MYVELIEAKVMPTVLLVLLKGDVKMENTRRFFNLGADIVDCSVGYRLTAAHITPIIIIIYFINIIIVIIMSLLFTSLPHTQLAIHVA